MLTLLLILSLQGGQIVVGGAAGHSSIAAALEVAEPGDTVRVLPGTYREHVVISKPVTLAGQPGAVIDGGGSGVVVRVNAPARVSGFLIRGSGSSQSQEDAGIMVEKADGVVIEDNALEDVLFGIYFKQSDEPIIRGNRIEGKDLPMSLRGDGIRLWYSRGGLIESNTLHRSRDIVIWFSDGTRVSGNRVTASRYGLHYMYSDDNEFRNNEFIGNEVGAFLMYSKNILFYDNLFADARGVTGRGLGFKDTDGVRAEGNVIVRNATGIFIDNSPTTAHVVNRFTGNVLAFNDVGVQLLPSVRSNEFRGNSFLSNVVPAAVTGAGDALKNDWTGNYWSEYAGFDGDGDGRGDTPFSYERLSDDLLGKYEELRVFNLGLAAAALDALSRALPLLAPRPLLVDSLPAVEPVGLESVESIAGGTRGPLAAGLLAISLAVAGLVYGLRRSVGRSA
ncbi:MAG: nitrous oxide reductase family maturation protein NosD [Gemmatimonadota bacterium]|nr:MAG: nitrous oxide reductase family maturation protein NosD [Gemmatimonadota bacterium]